MEKVIYLVWRDPAITAADFNRQLREQTASALKKTGAHSLTLNLPDADVAPAAGVRQAHLRPPPDALVQVWVDSAIAHLRKPFDDAIGPTSVRFAAYLVTESQPLVNRKHPPADGGQSVSAYSSCHTSNTSRASALSAPERRPHMNAKPTKKAKAIERDTLRAEYRREDLGKGVRGKYFKQHAQGTNLVLLQPEVAKVFPTPAAVNEALRGLMRVAQRVTHT